MAPPDQKKPVPTWLTEPRRITRTCARCSGTFDERAFFRRNVLHASSTTRRRHHVCIGCETTARTAEKQTNRFIPKARDTIRRHAARFGIPPAELITRYGWPVHRLAHDAEHAFHNGCRYCEVPYASMRNALADITLDIVDPAKPPYYATNTLWCCATCNRAKSTMSPEEWHHRLQAWKAFHAHLAECAVNPLAGLPLFA